MARPQKHTVDYFSHDSDASEGKTLSILFNNFGHEGISCWWQLLERISRTNNHVISLRNGEDLEYLAAKLHFQSDRLQQILQKMAELEAIDRELFNYGIIWSQNFVDRLEPVYKTRKQTAPPKPLLPPEKPLIKQLTELSRPEIPQTKLKETKVYNKSNVDKKLSTPNGLKVKEVFARIDKLRGYRPPKRAAEAGAILRMLKVYTPDQIIETWQKLKEDKFWQTKELFLMSVESQIGAVINNGKETPQGKYKHMERQ